MTDTGARGRWLNRAVLGIGLASLFSDWSHAARTAAEERVAAAP
jgi:hypothetical protein